jgi:hypothetical protein
MQIARVGHAAVLLRSGKVLIAGGWIGRVSSSPDEAVQLHSGQLLIAGRNRQAELYDERTGKFTVVGGDTGDSRHFMSETLLGDGRVLLAGGYAYSPEATAQTWISWIYKP